MLSEPCCALLLMPVSVSSAGCCALPALSLLLCCYLMIGAELLMGQGGAARMLAGSTKLGHSV
jgi:hypothetical protein